MTEKYTNSSVRPVKIGDLNDKLCASSSSSCHSEDHCDHQEAAGNTASSRRGIYRLIDRVSWRMTLWLLAVWLVLMWDIQPVTWVAGIILSLCIQVLFPLPHMRFIRAIRPVRCLILLARFIWDVFVSAIKVSWIIVRGLSARSYRVTVPLCMDSELYVTLTADMSTLTPGTIVTRAHVYPPRLELDVCDRTLFGNETDIISDTQSLERRIVYAFGSAEDIHLWNKRYKHIALCQIPDIKSADKSPVYQDEKLCQEQQ